MNSLFIASIIVFGIGTVALILILSKGIQPILTKDDYSDYIC